MGWWRVLEGLGIIAGIVYAVVTFLMWRESHIEQRAWLNFKGRLSDSMVTQGAQIAGQPLVGQVLMTNAGKTTAKKVFSDWNIELLRNTEEPSYKYCGPHTTQFWGLVQQGTDATINVVGTGQVTTSQAEDLAAGRSYIAFYGAGRYEDIYGEQHWFHYCYWKNLFHGGSYQAFSCTAYNDTGDGTPPKINNDCRQ